MCSAKPFPDPGRGQAFYIVDFAIVCIQRYYPNKIMGSGYKPQIKFGAGSESAEKNMFFAPFASPISMRAGICGEFPLSVSDCNY